MASQQYYSEETLAWLLGEDCPSVRYFTLRDILGYSQEDSSVKEAQGLIMISGLVPQILSEIRDPAYQNYIHRFYHAKYLGLVWQTLVLAELGAGSNDQIKNLCEYLLDHSQVEESGGFSTQPSSKSSGGQPGPVIPCLSGNVVWALLHFGYIDDPRLHKGIIWIVDHLHVRDGNQSKEQDPRFTRFSDCWGNHSCFMGVIKSLKALVALPKEHRSAEEICPNINYAIASMADFFLIHHINKRSHDLNAISRPGWQKFAFPLMYQTDTLDILDILTAEGIHDERMIDAIHLVQQKQLPNGRWKAEYTALNAKLLHPLSQEEMDKFITLKALRVLKRWQATGN